MSSGPYDLDKMFPSEEVKAPARKSRSARLRRRRSARRTASRACRASQTLG